MTTENTGGTPPANTGGTPPAPAGTPWFQGKITDNDVIGHMQNRGWHTKSVEDVAIEAVKAHREAEKLRGVPQDELYRLPKDTTSAEWNKLYARLGKPESADKYDFAGVKFTNGADIDPNFANAIREAAFKNHLPASAAAEMAKGVIKFMEDADARETTERTARLQTERAALAKNWNVKPEEAAIKSSPFFMLAQNALRALKWDAEIVNALEGQVGYAKVMDALATLGKQMGEDRYISSDKGANNGMLTREQAVTRINELKKDAAWVKKYFDGDSEAKREMWQLNQIISGVSAA